MIADWREIERSIINRKAVIKVYKSHQHVFTTFKATQLAFVVVIKSFFQDSISFNSLLNFLRGVKIDSFHMKGCDILLTLLTT